MAELEEDETAAVRTCAPMPAPMPPATTPILVQRTGTKPDVWFAGVSSLWAVTTAVSTTLVLLTAYLFFLKQLTTFGVSKPNQAVSTYLLLLVPKDVKCSTKCANISWCV